MNRTGKIAIAGSIRAPGTKELRDMLIPFLDSYAVSKGKYKLVLNDDGDNLWLAFNDPSDFEINFFDFVDGKFLVNAFNENCDVEALPILKALVEYFDSKEVVYHIEIQYEYENGDWKDEGVFVNE